VIALDLSWFSTNKLWLGFPKDRIIPSGFLLLYNVMQVMPHVMPMSTMFSNK
jgi:hypothetical protein